MSTMSEVVPTDVYYTWKVVDDGFSSTPRIEYFDKSGVDVSPLPLYVPEPMAVSAVKDNRMK